MATDATELKEELTDLKAELQRESAAENFEKCLELNSAIQQLEAELATIQSHKPLPPSKPAPPPSKSNASSSSTSSSSSQVSCIAYNASRARSLVE
jgi:hypothetical protein